MHQQWSIEVDSMRWAKPTQLAWCGYQVSNRLHNYNN
jgi:hypothetical protein